MKSPHSKSSLIPVGVVWLLVVVAFGAFNAVYWPLVVHQDEIDPMNFIDHAQVLYAVGRTEEAMGWMRGGIAGNRPPFPEPYEQLADWYRVHGYEEGARTLEPRVTFYQARTAAEQSNREKLLQAAVVKSLALMPAPGLAGATAAEVDAMAEFLGHSFQLGPVVRQWNPQERLALLRLAGGPVRGNRLIGNTGVRSPVDILVLSGGGDGSSRVARILAGNRGYEGAERGLHVMLLDPETGHVRNVMAFDTWASEEESERLTVFLNEAPEGTIGVFAVLDDASGHSTPALEDALLDFGLQREAQVARQPALLGERFSFAAIGVKGAPLGSGLQSWSPGQFIGVPGHPVALGVVQDQREDGA